MAAGQKANNHTAQKKKQASSDSGRAREQIGIIQELILLAALGFCILLFISGFGFGGRVTDSISEVLFGAFGFMGYLFPILFFMGVFFIIMDENVGKMISKVLSGIVMFLAMCILLQVFNGNDGFDPKDIQGFFSFSMMFKKGGGAFGAIACGWFSGMLGRVGTGVICVLLILAAMVILTRKSFFRSLSIGRKKLKDSAKKDSVLRKRRAAIRKEEQYKKKKDDLEYKYKERQIQYQAKQRRRQQHLEDMEVKKQQRLEELEAKRQKEAKEAKRRSAMAASRSRDTDFAVTDLKKGPAPGLAKTEKEIKKDKKSQDLQINPMGRVGLEKTPVVTTLKSSGNDFTITRGGTSTMVKLSDPGREIAQRAAQRRKHAEDKVSAGQEETSKAVSQTSSQPEKKPAGETVTKKDAAEAMNQVMSEIAAGGQTVEKEEAFAFPPLDFLRKGSGSSMGDSDEVLRSTAMKLQQTLHSFGVDVTVLDVSCGPAVTRYELQPEVGVKVSRIVSLADDIKLNLAVPDIRIEAPIPGKPAVGIEVPNTEKSPVYLRELLESRELKANRSVLAFAAGKDISGKVIVADLAKMPHMLVAGTTGSGKSVFTNSIILSMLYRAKPSELRFIIIDPKVVEFGVYNGIPHLMIPVVTDPKKAAGALNWAVAEMSERYKRFAEMQVRDLDGYNAKIDSLKDIPLQEGEERPQRLPKIVIIIDELADLMMVAAKEVEDAICRLAQLARAAGIHMIIATQRPSVDVVTGLIKANIPSRVALSVASGTDSRTILDMNGAEKLLGNGDMLFYPSGYPKPIRVQGAFVSDQEVGKIVGFLKEQNQAVVYNKDVEEKMNNMQAGAFGGTSSGEEERDEYFADAGRFIIEKEKASIGMLQRVFKIGFNRAARIMDQLAQAGVVGEEEGTKPRKILMSMTDFENYLEETGT